MQHLEGYPLKEVYWFLFGLSEQIASYNLKQREGAEFLIFTLAVFLLKISLPFTTLSFLNPKVKHFFWGEGKILK